MEKILPFFSPYQKPPPLWRLRPSRVPALQTCLPAGLAHPSFKAFPVCFGRFLKLIPNKCRLGPWTSTDFSGKKKKSSSKKDRDLVKACPGCTPQPAPLLLLKLSFQYLCSLNLATFSQKLAPCPKIMNFNPK